MEKSNRTRKKANPRHDSLERVSEKKFIPDDQLQDTPARLFRKLIKELGIGYFGWTKYLREYLEWIVTTEDEEKAKTERQTRAGNIRDTYFQKPTLSFNKLIEGVSILQFEECEVQLTLKDVNGNIVRVSDTIKLVSKSRKDQILKQQEKDAAENGDEE